VAAREVLGQCGALLAETDEVDGLVDVARRGVVAGVEVEAFLHREAGLGLRLLQDGADAVAPGPPGIGRADAEHRDFTGRSLTKAFQDFDGRCLAGAVGSVAGKSRPIVCISLLLCSRSIGADLVERYERRTGASSAHGLNFLPSRPLPATYAPSTPGSRHPPAHINPGADDRGAPEA
jgi:hypothetical protein